MHAIIERNRCRFVRIGRIGIKSGLRWPGRVQRRRRRTARDESVAAAGAASGGLAERFNAAVLKTVVGQPTGGSNPSPSANESAAFVLSLGAVVESPSFKCLQRNLAASVAFMRLDIAV